MNEWSEWYSDGSGGGGGGGGGDVREDTLKATVLCRQKGDMTLRFIAGVLRISRHKLFCHSRLRFLPRICAAIWVPIMCI